VKLVSIENNNDDPVQDQVAKVQEELDEAVLDILGNLVLHCGNLHLNGSKLLLQQILDCSLWGWCIWSSSAIPRT
jgi:hypothetical protein